MVKQNISFRIDKDKYERFKEIVGGRPSEFIQRIIDAVIETPPNPRDMLYSLRLQLQAYQIARQLLLLRLRVVEQRIAELEEHLRELEEQIKREEVDERFAELMRRLNEIIRYCEYDFWCAWENSEAVRAELAQLGFNIDREWLLRHIERLLTW